MTGGDAPRSSPLPQDAVAPGFVIAAPHAGSGTATLTAGLMAALSAEGAAVAPFTVGAEHVDAGSVDPGHQAVATGRPHRGLDPVLVGARRIGMELAGAGRSAGGRRHRHQ